MINSLTLQVIIYCVCFILVWFGAGLVVSVISDISKSWKLPAFFVSFFLLGLLTSLPEITIGTISILNDDPAIMVGNLLGGIIVIFLGVIPLLGMVGNGVRMPIQINKKQLVMTLLVVVAPAFLTADQRLGKWEGIFLIALYCSLFLFFSSKKSFMESMKSALHKKKKNTSKLVFKVILGVAILILASNQIVNSTLYFADILKISPFFVSLIIVALGTNIPEISIIFRAVMSNKKEIAFADYLGSASANTLLIGVFTLMHGKAIELPDHFIQRFTFLIVGLILFFFFLRSRSMLSRKESAILLLLYLGFVLFEIFFITDLV